MQWPYPATARSSGEVGEAAAGGKRGEFPPPPPLRLEQTQLDPEVLLGVLAEVADQGPHLGGELVDVLVEAGVVDRAPECALALIELAGDFAGVGEGLLGVVVEGVVGDELAHSALAGLAAG